MRHPYRSVGLATVAIVLTSCSVSYPFELLLTVKNTEDGTPIEGVSVVLDPTNTTESKDDFKQGNYPSPTHRRETNADGQLSVYFQFNSRHDVGRFWWLKLRKEGFEPTVIDIRPDPVPESTQRTVLPVTVQMKPLPKKP
jgi:hypothetical protein